MNRELRRWVTERRRLVELLRLAGAPAVAAYGGSMLVGALAPSAMALVTGWLVSRTVEPDHRQSVIVPVVALAVVLIARQLAGIGQEVAGVAVARRIDGTIRGRTRELTLVPREIGHLEQADLQDDLSRLWDTGGWINRTRSPGTAAVGVVALTFQMLGAGLAAAVLWAFSPLLAVGLLVLSLLARSTARRQWVYLTEVVDGRAGHRRRVHHWSELAMGAEGAKEVRVFGLATWLAKRRERAALDWAGPIWTARRRAVGKQGATFGLAAGAGVAALVVPGLAAATGRIGAEELVVYLVAAWGVFSAATVESEAFETQYGLRKVEALHRITSRYTSGSAGRPRPQSIAGADDGPAGAPRIELAGVRFAYPDADRPVLDGVDLTIQSREVLAIVGRNGAGKTTLIKLLGGLYRPTGGHLLVDGHPLTDLSDAELAAWRRRIAVVFQDFVHYPATIGDNIALAAPECRDETDKLREAAERAGLGDLLARLPHGLATPLWSGGTNAIELSGGQWQRLAIARALFAVECGRRLLVLDEPTAHLDVRAEAAFFDEIVRATPGIGVVLISHRLSTVRPADRIALLQDGRIAELGSHDELVEQDGQYARLFRLQAARFQADLDTAPERP